jgi:hypothetical protein
VVVHNKSLACGGRNGKFKECHSGTDNPGEDYSLCLFSVMYMNYILAALKCCISSL